MGLLGLAIAERLRNRQAPELTVCCDRAMDEPMNLGLMLSQPAAWPALDRVALSAARGRVLDLGAGAGRHSLALQAAGWDVTSLEADPLLCCRILGLGVRDVRCQAWQRFAPGAVYDTAIVMMNGIGLGGRQADIPAFLAHVKSWLKPGGALLIDTSDVTYLKPSPLPGRTVHEVQFRFRYRGAEGAAFDWAFLPKSLAFAALRKAGFRQVEEIFKDKGGRSLLKAIA